MRQQEDEAGRHVAQQLQGWRGGGRG
jgi:hypothetical protein